MTMTADSFL